MLSRAEVAEILGVRPQSISQAIWRGKMPIPYYKTGNFIRFKESDVTAYLESVKVEARA